MTQGEYEIESFSSSADGAVWRHKTTDRGGEFVYLLVDGKVVAVPARAGRFSPGGK